MNTLEEFAARQQLLREWVIRAEAAVVNLESKTAIKAAAEKLSDNRFVLAVLGQFKRGKTTFINALLGENLLPTAVIPLTSIITVLKYGTALDIKIFFNDGRVKTISRSDLQLYVTEKDNPRNEKAVHHVEISHPSLYLKQGIQIVDTPGVASVHEHNTQTTFEFLPQADAGIFLVGADPPVTQAELQFLREVKGYVSRLFFVQNKMDAANFQDWREALEFTKAVIEEQAKIEDVKIFPLSAKLALEGKVQHDNLKIAKSGLPEFEQALEEFVTRDKGWVLLKSLAGKVLRVVDQEILIIDIKLKSLQSSKQELDAKLSQFNAALAAVQKQQTQDEYLLKGEITSIIQILEADLQALKTQFTAELAKLLEQWREQHKQASAKSLAKILDAEIGAKIQDIFTVWKVEEERKIQRLLAEALGQFSERVNGVAGQIMSAAAELFGLSLDLVNIRENLSKDSGFDFKLKEDVQVSLDTLTRGIPYFLPGFIGRKIVLKRMKAYAEDMVDRHCGRLHYDFVQRIDSTQNKFKAQLRSNTQNLIGQITAAIKLGQDMEVKSKIEVETARASLQAQTERLEEIRRELAAI